MRGVSVTGAGTVAFAPGCTLARVQFDVQIGLLLAVATVASIVGFLYKHRGAMESPRSE
jgi:hypothetical protein